MFAVVDLSENEKRIFEKRRKHPVTVKRCDVPYAAPFFILRSHCLYYDEEEILRTVKRYGCSVFPKDAYIPEKIKPTLFEPSVLPLKMLIKTVCGLCLLNPQKSRGITVGIIDREGKAVSQTEEISDAVRYVRVFSEKTRIYEKMCGRLLDSNGSAAVISERTDIINGCDIALSLKSSFLAGLEFKKGFVYENDISLENVCEIRNSDAVYGGFDYEKYNVDKYFLFCALYECCGMRVEKIPQFNCGETLLDL